jgi:hypothetical protein
MDYYLEKLCDLGAIRVNDKLHIKKNYINHKDPSKAPKYVDIECSIISINN